MALNGSRTTPELSQPVETFERQRVVELPEGKKRKSSSVWNLRWNGSGPSTWKPDWSRRPRIDHGPWIECQGSAQSQSISFLRETSGDNESLGKTSFTSKQPPSTLLLVPSRPRSFSKLSDSPVQRNQFGQLCKSRSCRKVVFNRNNISQWNRSGGKTKDANKNN